MSRPEPTVLCQNCAQPLRPPVDSGVQESVWQCAGGCGFVAGGNATYVDLVASPGGRTADHYSLQWGGKLGFLEFIQSNPAAKSVMPGSQLGWPALFRSIRERAAAGPLWVYDAACGFGGIAAELIGGDAPTQLAYVGADIHSALDLVSRKVEGFDRCGTLLRWDISRPLPVAEKFDYVICRAALHHTPDPPASFRSLCAALKPGGTIAVSVYRRKSVCREASDDALRAVVSRLTPEEAFAACEEFTALGKALQAVEQRVRIDQELPLLGIGRGEYRVQELIYDHFLKCFHNAHFGDRYSTLVNYDWYHPEFAFRYELEDVKAWFARNRIELLETTSIQAQHFLLGRKPAAT